MKPTVAWSVGFLALAAIVTTIASFGLPDFRRPIQVPATGRTAPTSIEILSTGFVPELVTVPVHSSVCWKNADTKAHRPFSDTSTKYALDSGKDLKPLETWCFPFTQAGTWDYVDKLNSELKGKITVQ